MFSTIPSLIARSFPGATAGPVLWTPADITTLGWWDASDAATVILSGSNVTQWDDKSGNNYDGTQSTAGLQPTYGTNTLNGLDVVTFDGGDKLALPAIAYNASKNLSIYSVGRKTSTNVYQVAFVANRSGNDSASLLYNVGGYEKWGTYTNGEYPANTSTVSGTYALFSLLGNAGGTAYFWFNGSADGSQGSWTVSTVFSEGYIGNDQFGSSLTGDIAEIVFIDAEDTTADRERMEGYLAWKWGLEGDLPVGHPYKNSPPYVTPPAPSYLLDTYGGSSVAYSVRRLSSSYSGSAIRVRRSSDNSEQDIGFVGENLDTSALTTFCSGTDGFVATWYDQSGNAEDLVQANTGKQPKIVSSGSIITYNGKPTLQFDGTDDYLENAVAYGSNVSLYYVTQRVGNGSGADSYRPDIGLVYTSDKGAFHYVNPSLQGAAYPFFNTGGSYDGFGTYANGDKYLINFEWEVSVGFSIYRNNALEKDVTGSVSIPSSTTGLTVSYQKFGTTQERFSNNNFCEIILWPANQSSNRSAINSNMNSYFSVY